MARQRNYHEEYLRRRERAGKLSPYEATHRQGGRAPVFLQGQDQAVNVQLSYASAKRAGQYDNDVQRLLKGQLTEAEFDKKWAKRAPLRVESGGELPAGRYKFADADTALYLAESARALPDRQYADRMHFDIQGS